ncbi:MAG: hypothetical protein R2939_08445 [Kofleriaceae bacterium]
MVADVDLHGRAVVTDGGAELGLETSRALARRRHPSTLTRCATAPRARPAVAALMT